MSKKNKKKNNNQQPTNSAPVDYYKAYQQARQSVQHLDKQIKRTVTKGVQYDWLNNTSFNNVVYPKDKIPDRLLRMVERRNGIVGATITLRIQQIVEFSNISTNPDIPGWEFVLKDEKASINPEKEKQKKYLQSFLMKTKCEGYAGLEPKYDTLKDLMTKYVRDRILIDKVVWEVERDRKGQAVAIWCVDGATILPILPGGFYGSTSSIGTGIGMSYNRVTDAIRKAKLENIPPVEEISYIQELLYGSSGGGVTAAFRDTDLIYDLSNELNDIRYYRQGFSVVEKANIAIVAFINSLTFNSNGLSRGAIPKIAIAMGKESGYTTDQLEDAQDEWMANFSSMDGQWNIPLLNGDAKVLNLLPNNRDMEYQKYMEFVASITCAEIGVDPAELGLRLNQAQQVMSENQDAKQLFSKNRGLKDILNGFIYIVNRFLDISNIPFAGDWKFRFNGLSTEDKGFESDLRKKAIETDTTINEIRKAKDLPPDPYGDIICNPQYIQYRMGKEAAEQQKQIEQDQGGGEGEEEDDFNFSDDDIDGIIDETMQKAVRLI